jgi:hypothetical protein
MVLNPRTGHVLPQFHVVFDDLFTMVPYMNKNEIPPNWADLVKKSSEHLIDKIHDVPLAKTWLFPDVEHGDFILPCKKQPTIIKLLPKTLATLFTYHCLIQAELNSHLNASSIFLSNLWQTTLEYPKRILSLLFSPHWIQLHNLKMTFLRHL